MLSLVLCVQCLCAQALEVYEVPDAGGLCRLSASVDASAGARHDLDEVVTCLAVLHLCQDLSGVLQSGGCHNADGVARDGICGFLDALVGSADFHEIGLLQLLAGEGLGCRSQSGLHDSAGSSEDVCGACGIAHQGIILLIGQTVEPDAGSLDHTSELSCGQSDVYVADVLSGCVHEGSSNLELLGHAGHDGHADDIPGIDACLLGIVCLGCGAEHLLRALAGRQVGDEFREEGLAELDPAR